MWSQNVRTAHLIKVSPFLFFPPRDARADVSLEGCVARWQPPMGPAGSEEVASDRQLPAVAEILRRLHRGTFGGDSGSRGGVGADPPEGGVPFVSDMLPALRRATLHGCVVAFTGVSVVAPTHPLAWWCQQLGAAVQGELSAQVTHLVAARRDTGKCAEARRRLAEGPRGLHVVHPGWVLRALATWRRPCEVDFALPPEGPLPDFCGSAWSLPRRPPPQAATAVACAAAVAPTRGAAAEDEWDEWIDEVVVGAGLGKCAPVAT
mmetsp:Transcript_49392/g.132588  ORF Transcript_49392/g.132588 Transcript_49392/m.132588 type:complete len:263 (+) Transcript_49392:1808-2596(+)